MKHAIVLASIVAAAVVAPTGTDAQTVSYVVLNDRIGRPGSQTVERADDGTFTVRFIYKNNGRGPELVEQFRLAADGTFSEYHVNGTSTFGAVVDEHFERNGDVAAWRSTSEEGTVKLSGAAMYVPLNSSLAPLGVFAGAMASLGSGAMPLVPNGTMRMQKLDEVEVRKGDGSTQRVQLLAQTGLGFGPWFYWATTGSAPRLFASADLQEEIFIEAGWEENRKLLEDRQRAAERQALRDRAERLRHRLPGLTVVRNARIFDSEKATIGSPSDIYMLRGRITQILPAGSVPGDADNEIDAAGRIVIPGLFDMHAHVWRWNGALDLAAGVTSVRDGQRQRRDADDARGRVGGSPADAADRPLRIPGGPQPLFELLRFHHQHAR